MCLWGFNATKQSAVKHPDSRRAPYLVNTFSRWICLPFSGEIRGYSCRREYILHIQSGTPRARLSDHDQVYADPVVHGSPVYGGLVKTSRERGI